MPASNHFRRAPLSITLAGSLLLLATGCNRSAKTAQHPPPATAVGAGESVDKTPQASGLDLAPTVLVGLYTMAEVQHKGKVTMIPPSFAVSMAFQTDGTFSRVSKRSGKPDHTDGGDFQMVGRDELILNITFSGNKPATQPRQQTYKFTLSRDREELSLSGTDGKLAVFRRQAKGSAN